MWFEFPAELKDDLRVDNLYRSMRLGKVETIGHLALLYSWTANGRCFDGDLSGLTPEQLAEAAALNRDRGDAWAKALIEFGFLSRDPSAPPLEAGKALSGHTSVVDWIEFCGEPIRKRIERRAADGGSHADANGLDGLLVSLASSGLRSSSSVWSVYLVLKYIKKQKNKEETKKDTRWDLLNKDRQLPWCKKILDAYEGDVKKAATAMLSIGEHYEHLGLNWDASTVHKRLTDWEEGRLNGNR